MSNDFFSHYMKKILRIVTKELLNVNFIFRKKTIGRKFYVILKENLLIFIILLE